MSEKILYLLSNYVCYHSFIQNPYSLIVIDKVLKKACMIRYEFNRNCFRKAYLCMEKKILRKTDAWPRNNPLSVLARSANMFSENAIYL